jgi:hypothetical protein
MADKTRDELVAAVNLRYGDADGTINTSAEIEEYLKEGYNQVCSECPWLTPDSQTVTATTSSLGEIALTEPDVGTVIQVALSKSGVFEPLLPVSMENWNTRILETATSADQIYEYALEGPTLYLHPIVAGVSVTVRVSYQGATGVGFPASGVATLPATMPKAVDSMLIRYALYELFSRDGDFEAADRALMDFQRRIQQEVGRHNQPQLGSALTLHQTDFYLLDSEGDAW